MQVEFHKITGYGNYSVSNTGLVWNDSIGKTLRPFNNNEYQGVKLSLKGIGKKFRVHRLVANAFIPNPENKTFVEYIDCNRVDNHITNLRLCRSVIISIIHNHYCN